MITCKKSQVSRSFLDVEAKAFFDMFDKFGSFEDEKIVLFQFNKYNKR